MRENVEIFLIVNIFLPSLLMRGLIYFIGLSKEKIFGFIYPFSFILYFSFIILRHLIFQVFFFWGGEAIVVLLFLIGYTTFSLSLILLNIEDV